MAHHNPPGRGMTFQQQVDGNPNNHLTSQELDRQIEDMSCN